MKRTIPWVLALGLLVAAGPAAAGLHYTARTWTEGEGASELGSLYFETHVAGLSAAVRFLESGNPFITAGSRLVTKDGGKSFYMVNDEAKTYSKWDIDGFVNAASSVIKALGPLVKIKVENAKVETLLEEPGPVIAGERTEHVRSRTSYDITTRALGIGQKQSIESLADYYWLTRELDDAAMSVWIQRDPPDMGDEGLNELVRLEASKFDGRFPMKSIVEQVTTGKKQQTTQRTITLVETFEVGPVAGHHFEIDPSYQMTAATPFPTQAGQPDDDEQEGSKKGRFRKLIKRDGN